MTILFQAASIQITPQVRSIPFNVAADATQIQLTLTHGDWPEGPVIRLDVKWGGVVSGVFQCSGGLVRDKQGNPTGGTTVVTWTTSKPPGFTSGVAEVEILQTLTTGILVESF